MSNDPKRICLSAYEMASRFVGVKEIPGRMDDPFILAMLQLDSNWPEHDEVPWCSAYCNFVSWLLRLPRSKSLMARSWLSVGTPVDQNAAEPYNDVVVLWRGSIEATTGHVAFFSGWENDGKSVLLLGGNQSNSVNITSYPVEKILGIRRLLR